MKTQLRKNFTQYVANKKSATQSNKSHQKNKISNLAKPSTEEN